VRRLASFVAFAALAGCASAPLPAPRRASEPESVVVERGGHAACVVARDEGATYVFESGDGVHWHEVSQETVPLDSLEGAPGWTVSRDYDSSDAGATPFRLWREDGMAWKQVATLRASSVPPVGE